MCYFQGVFIFLFHCVGDEKIRREYIRIICCRDKGPAYTNASKSPKSGDSSGDKIIKSMDNDGSKVINCNTGSTVCHVVFQAP
ncbi:hypothetical protein QZH41_015389 [Actinostola sp. cb2023]|nr:hypothetical protein QZH41_015389 [Actinostola sp. cb2023]